MKNKKRNSATARPRGKYKTKASLCNMGIIGDTHAPFEVKGYLEFCQETFDRFNCGAITHIGDLVDNHAMSYHESDPDGLSAGDEAEQAMVNVRKWTKAFPKVNLCLGNHDELVMRKMHTSGIPRRFFKDFADSWDLPSGWNVAFDFVVDGVLYQHGTKASGGFAYSSRAKDNMMNTVIGHTHSTAGVHHMASKAKAIWGMGVGCGVDNSAYSMAYGKSFPKKPIIGCGVVLDNGQLPLFIPMEL